MVTGRPRKEFDEAKVRALREQGLSWRKISLIVGVHYNTLMTRGRDKRLREFVGDGKKRCGGCQEVLSVDAFSVDRSRTDGLNSRCRKCNKLKWQSNYEICVDCGGRRSAARGQRCRRCYHWKSVVTRSEEEIINTIPSLIAAANRELTSFINSLAVSGMTKEERLLALLQKVS